MAKTNLFIETRFFGRERELEQIASCITVEGICTVIGPRGIGKTALASRIGGIVADCALHFDARTLLHTLAKELVRVRSVEGPLHFWHVNARISPTEIQPLANASVSDLAKELVEVANQGEVPFPIVLDEFQDLEDAEDCFELLSVLFNRGNGAQLVLTTSSEKAFDAFCEKMKKAFKTVSEELEFDCGAKIELQRITVEEWRSFISRLFRESGKRCENALVNQMYQNTRGHTATMLALAQRLWDITDHVSDDNLLKEAFKSVVKDARSSLESMWLGLAFNEKRLLAALGADPTNKPQGRAWLSKHRFSSSSLARSMDGLKDKGLIYCDPDKYFRPVNPLMEEIFGS